MARVFQAGAKKVAGYGLVHGLTARAFAFLPFAFSCKKVNCIPVSFRVQPKNSYLACPLHFLQESFSNQPVNRRLGLLQGAMHLLFQQTPARDSFETVCRFLVTYEVTQNLFQDSMLWLCLQQWRLHPYLFQLSCVATYLPVRLCSHLLSNATHNVSDFAEASSV